jgi:hypothetical protein
MNIYIVHYKCGWDGCGAPWAVFDTESECTAWMDKIDNGKGNYEVTVLQLNEWPDS